MCASCGKAGHLVPVILLRHPHVHVAPLGKVHPAKSGGKSNPPVVSYFTRASRKATLQRVAQPAHARFPYPRASSRILLACPKNIPVAGTNRRRGENILSQSSARFPHKPSLLTPGTRPS
eukprot:1178144-Prorocentrum_minimum.AAC.2